MTLIVDEDQADTYFETRRDAGPWDAVTETGGKITELTTAQNQLELYYTLDPDNEKHRNAVCEQAYFNLRYGGGIEDRLSQRAVGVVGAGLIKETFDPKSPVRVVICPYAMAALSGVLIKPSNMFFGFVNIERDDDA